MVVMITSGGIPSKAVSFGGGGDDRFNALVANADGIVAVGRTDGNVTIGSEMLVGGGGLDAGAVKLSAADLSPIWARGAGGIDAQEATSVGVDALDRIAVAGWLKETIDFGTLLTSTGNDDAFLIQLTP